MQPSCSNYAVLSVFKLDFLAVPNISQTGEGVFFSLFVLIVCLGLFSGQCKVRVSDYADPLLITFSYTLTLCIKVKALVYCENPGDGDSFFHKDRQHLGHFDHCCSCSPCDFSVVSVGSVL